MTGPIVVGVDESAVAGDALRWALREALVRDCGVEVVAVWQLPVSPLGLDPAGYNDYLRGPLAEECRRDVDVLVTAARVLEPATVAVPVSVSVVEGDPARRLLEASAGAELLVVGSRGLHGPARLLGSVSAVVVKKAPCPVVVVHHGPGEPSAPELAAARLVVLAG